MATGSDDTVTSAPEGKRRLLRLPKSPFRKSKKHTEKAAEKKENVAKRAAAASKEKAKTAATAITKAALVTKKEEPSKTEAKAAAEEPKEAGEAKEKKKLSTSWLCRSKRFQQLCDWAFEVVDADKSGYVDEKELYSGLLLIHLKLGTYAGPAACRPLGRERCLAIFEKMDVDDSGNLDKDEFREVMMVLFSNVLFRVTVQWSMTLIIVPLVAQRILNGIYWLIACVVAIITTLDEYSSVADMIELSLEAAGACVIDHTPSPIKFVAEKIGYLLACVPESVWNTVPLTLLSTILGILVVPRIIFKIDDYFHYLADRKAKKAE